MGGGGTEDMDAVTVFENRLADLGIDVAGTHNRQAIITKTSCYFLILARWL